MTLALTLVFFTVAWPDRSDEMSASGVDLSGRAWNEKSIGVFLTKEFKDSKLFYWSNSITIKHIYSAILKTCLNNIEINRTVLSQFKQTCKIILVDYMASKMIECVGHLFHSDFNRPKTDRSSGCKKCDECADRQ